MAYRNPKGGAFGSGFPINNRFNQRGGGSSQPLSASLSSLSASVSSRNGGPRGPAVNSISKTYRQASTLFLTRRLPEALTTLLPLITPHSDDDNDNHQNHKLYNGDDSGSAAATASAVEPAPVAAASRGTRSKVWSLYLTILNAVLELEPDEGKDAFGTHDWRTLCTKVRDGDIWEEVVQNGYHGAEGDVDPEVVVNLATLLLAHANSQLLNQRRLESYLSYSQMPQSLDLSGRFGPTTPTTPTAAMAARSLSRHRSQSRGSTRSRGRATPGGTDTPRDLNSRVMVLELYTLHVLPRNNEWDYAREFISASPLLDEERRDAFLQALQSLHDDQQAAEERAQEEKQRHEEAIRRDLEEVERVRAENEELERRRIEEERRARREGSVAGSSVAGGRDGDDAISTTSSTAYQRQSHYRRPPSSSAGRSTSSRAAAGTRSNPRTSAAAPPSPYLPQSAQTASSSTAAGAPPRKGSKRPPTKAGAAARKPPSATTAAAAAAAPPTTVAARTAVLFANVRGLVGQMALALNTSPMALVRALLFIVALLVMLGRRNMRERIARVLGRGWHKVKATAGMGVKVSYI